jgi:hypothetical protein
MESKRVDTNNEGQLLAHLKTIASSLEKLALLRELDAFYSSDERKHLVTEYRALRRADAIAFAGIEAAREELGDAGLGWEARVEKYGEEEAKRRNAPMMASLDVRRAAMKQVSEFERRHPAIIALLLAYPGMGEPEPAGNNA